MKVTDPPIIVQETVNRNVAEVWAAITELEQMHQWYFDNIPAFEPVVGFETSFDVVAPSQVFPHYWKIVKAIPNEVIAYDWHFGDVIPGLGLVTWTIRKINDQTELELRDDVIEPFPSDIPEFKRESGVEGWNYFIKDRLKNYLNR